MEFAQMHIKAMRIKAALIIAASATTMFAASLSFGQVEPRISKTAQPAQPVAVELFTSQGCSSCPPADALLEKLARIDGIIAISRPVTYWDRLGWKDTLAREENTTLQRAYSSRGLIGRNGVYTPQLVIDGQFGVIGSDVRQIVPMIQASSPAPAAIAVRPQDDGSVVVGLAGETPGAAELILVAMKSHVNVRVVRGENGDRALRYTNVLRSETKIADWNGGKADTKIAPSLLQQEGSDRYALLLRRKNAGPILAAKRVPTS
jgi:hypothetical protein